jgi:hypothetical protein
MKKKSSCGFRFKAKTYSQHYTDDWTLECVTHDAGYYACKVTKEKCIGLKICPIRNK